MNGVRANTTTVTMVSQNGWLALFIMSRLTDILTTLYGYSLGISELNPIQDYLLKNKLFIPYQLGMMVIVSLFYNRIPGMKIFTVISCLVAILNLLTI